MTASVWSAAAVALACTVLRSSAAGVVEPATLGLSDDLFEGDMILTEAQEAAFSVDSTGHRALENVNPFFRWRFDASLGKVAIPYAFHPGNTFSSQEKAVIRVAIQDIEKRSKVLAFIERTDETAYLDFNNHNSGCWSYIGRVGFNQPVNLGAGCSTVGIASHEIIHALGFVHEQSRPDRNSYVTIKYENIRAGLESNFAIHRTSTDLETTYDYHSVMHYGEKTFGKKKVSCETFKTTCEMATIEYVGGSGETCVTDQATLEPCDPSSVSQQVYVRRVSNRYVELQIGDGCLGVDVVEGTKIRSSSALVKSNCSSSHYNQFEIHSYGNLALIASAADNVYCLRNNFDGTIGLDYCSTSSDAFVFALKFNTGQQVSGCDLNNVPTCNWLSYKYETTIDARGATVGQRDSASDEDIHQIQLFYQCSEPRTSDTLCSEDCPCFEGQFSCNTNKECQSGLVCVNRFCQAGEAPPEVVTSDPTRSPTRSPTGSPTAFPTLSPIKSPSSAPTSSPLMISISSSPTRSPTRSFDPPSLLECTSLTTEEACFNHHCFWKGSRRKPCKFPKVNKGSTVCSNKSNFINAELLCKRQGLTLCDAFDITEEGHAVERGCNTEQRFVWTQTPCNLKGGMAVVKQSNGKMKCKGPNAKAGVACCHPN